MITLGSLFDGIGGWQLAAVRNGVKPLWSSEIEPFPMEVTRRHFPDTKQLGDINTIHGDAIAPVDIICAGSPCQDLSIAGRRAGLEGKRSSLFYQSMRIVREMREATNGVYPGFFVWENVPGAYSSNHGRDFKAVLEEITEAHIPMPGSGRWARSGMVRSSKCGVAWRTLDAEFWGVPQHRERIFLIAGFGKWGGYTQVLFEPEGMCRNPPAGQTAREETAPPPSGSAGAASTVLTIRSGKVGGGKGPLVKDECSLTLGTHNTQTLITTEKLGGQIVNTLQARDYKGIGNQDVPSKLVVCDEEL